MRRLLNLKAGEAGRLGPFFLLYSVLFGCLAMADGVSLALFIERVGAATLPYYYGLTAAASLLLIYLYLRAAAYWSHATLFQFIILISAAQFLGAFAIIYWQPHASLGYGALFVSREVSYTLLLMHFGTYLQTYFRRDELNRVLPIVYAGGRLGGICGAGLLSLVSPRLGLVGLLPLIVLALGVCSAMVYGFHRLPSCSDESDDGGSETPAPIKTATTSYGLMALLRFVVSSPLILWFSTSGVIFMICRWILNYQYSQFFEGHFTTEVALAQYLAFYTQVALAFSLVFQLLCVSRLIERVGLKGTHMLYNVLMLAALWTNLGGLNLNGATFARFVETDLRFSLRNPVNQLITNKFSKATRVKARALTLGAVNPLATLLSSFVLLSANTFVGISIAELGLVIGVIYILISFLLYRSFI